MKNNTLQGKIIIPFTRSSSLLPEYCAGKTDREPSWTSQEFSSDDIISPWLFMLICYLGNEQWARTWPYFTDIIILTLNLIPRLHFDIFTSCQDIEGVTGYWLLLRSGIVQSVPCNCDHFLIYCAPGLSSNHSQFIHQSSLLQLQ
jgi:hypothetical protein